MEIPLPEDNVPGDNSTSGNKRKFNDLENAEDDISESKKVRMQLDKASKMLLLSQQSLQKFTVDLASSQNELETAKTEIKKWKSAFKKESFVPSGKAPEPEFVVDYIQSLRASEASLIEKLEIAEMKLAVRELKDEVKLKQASKQGGSNESELPCGKCAHAVEEMEKLNKRVTEEQEAHKKLSKRVKEEQEAHKKLSKRVTEEQEARKSLMKTQKSFRKSLDQVKEFLMLKFPDVHFPE